MGGARSGLGGPMCVQVLRVSGMPCNVDIWVDDDPDYFAVYIDESLITERGAALLQAVLRAHRHRWQRLDDSFVYRTLRAITG
jgi:hypothetical protein